MTDTATPATPATARTILCLSRSYLSRFIPALEARDAGARYLHMVQTDAEAAFITAGGGEVVLNIQQLVRDALRNPRAAQWREPADFRAVTGFAWSPIYADRYLPEYDPQTRGRIAEAIYARLSEIFTTQRIDGFLSEPVALFITHVALYLCRKHGAKPLLWANAYVPNYFYFSDNVDIATPSRRDPVAGAEYQAMAAATAAFADGVAEDRAGPAYHHSFLQRRLSSLTYFKQRRGEEPLVLRPGLKSRAIQLARLARVRLARARFPRSDFMTAGAVAEHKFYLRSLHTPLRHYDGLPGEYADSNVAYPLQYEPEASLLYFAPEFVDQAALVETVLRALPAGHVLWVKEHPNQFGALGEPRWRALKRRYANLRFVYGRESGRTLMRRAGLVVTISSSAGMDALLLGRRALVAGKIFYRTFTGALPIESPADIARLLNDPSIYGPVDNREANVRELTAFTARCYPGDPQPAHDLFTPANVDKIVAAIRAECGGA